MGRGHGCYHTHRDSGWRRLLWGTPVRPRPLPGPAPGLLRPARASFLPPCPSSPSVFKLYGFRHRAGRSSQPGLHSLVFGSSRDCEGWFLETLSARGEARESRDLARLCTPMFEEVEWAEEAPLAASLRPVASQSRTEAASQVKVSGPVESMEAVSGRESYIAY